VRAVAEELPVEGTRIPIDEAYAVCEGITRLQAKNFAYGIRLLPGPKRRALSAVYALARRIDDVGDGDLPVLEKLAGLEAIRADLRGIQDASCDPVLVAIRDAASCYPLPLGAFDELIQGCEMDCKGVRIGTFEELVQYCRLVAGTIGRLSLAIFGVPDFRAAEPLADALGVALQLTNILRDVREDKEQMGRIYLPWEDLKAHGCSTDLEPSDQNLPGLILFEAQRATSWYTEGLSLLPLLDRRSRACVATMAGIYRRLLQRIEADPALVLTTRVSLPVSEKLAVAARALAVGKA
jgi:phytoene synthase